jgi:hypothetical protein
VPRFGGASLLETRMNKIDRALMSHPLTFAYGVLIGGACAMVALAIGTAAIFGAGFHCS